MGLNFSMTGVFYNKKLAAQIGMTAPPTTLAELDDAAGEGQGARASRRSCSSTAAPRAAWRSRCRTSWPPTATAGPINDWIFQKPGATIDTPANLKAAQHLQQWIKAGYFAEGRQRASTTRR